MNTFPRSMIATLVALAISLCSVASVVVAQTPSAIINQHYVMIDLTPAGATTSSAAAMSSTQQGGSAGFLSAAGLAETHAIVWSGDANSYVDLGVGSINGMSDVQQVGASNNHAALWNGSAASYIDLNPGLWTQSIAYGVANGQQVGVAQRQQVCAEKKGACSSSGTYLVIHPFLWAGSADSAIDLAPSNLPFAAAGTALNTDGIQQVGYVQQVLGFNAFGGAQAAVWSGSGASTVLLHPANSSESQAKAVSNGQQVGFAFAHHAVIWFGSAASAIDINPAGVNFSEANATNGLQQAGFALVSSAPNLAAHSHAFVWSGSAASAIDLNQFMPIGFTDAAASGIDAAGNIVGWASKGPRSNPANVHAVMWMPSTTPAVSSAQSINANPNVISAGDSVQVSVSLDQPAPAGGAIVNLSNSITPPFGVTTPAVSVSMPAILTIDEGQTVGSFTLTTSLASVAGFTSPYGVDIQAAFGDMTQTATVVVKPPVFLSSLSVAPGNITTGSTATGTVSLNQPAPSGGAVVALSSSNAAAGVPASVTVPAGLSSATFSVLANPATTFTNVTITGTYGNAIPTSASASLVIAPPPVAVDTITIQKADYVVSKKQLNVQATSTSQTALLAVTVTSTGELIGYLTNKGAGSYAGSFIVATNPQNITVTSDLTGTANKAITLK